MKSNTIKTVLLGLMLSALLSACTEKGKNSTAESPKSDSTAKARQDSTDAAEAKDLKEVLEAAKK
jgi:outer membrane biogenesis lipoprotein LolB